MYSSSRANAAKCSVRLTKAAEVLGFAYDLAVLIKTKDREEMKHRSNESLMRINSWMDINQLELVPENNRSNLNLQTLKEAAASPTNRDIKSGTY